MPGLRKSERKLTNFEHIHYSTIIILAARELKNGIYLLTLNPSVILTVTSPKYFLKFPLLFRIPPKL